MTLSHDKSLNAWVFTCRGRTDGSDEYLIAQSAGFQVHYTGQNFKRKFVCWFTRNARVALKLAGYCDDDQERDRILAAAKDAQDPERVTITFDGADFRWYAPVADAAQYRDAPTFACWKFERSGPYWWTQQPMDAVLCVRYAIEHLGAGMLDIRAEALTMLNEYLSEWDSPLIDYTVRDVALVLPEKTNEPPETVEVRAR